MAPRTHVNEGSACYPVFTYEDQNGNPLIPASVIYKVDDLTNGVNIVPITAIVTPGLTNQVTITAAQNAMNSASLVSERRRVTVNVTAPGGDFRVDVQYYELRRVDSTK